MVKLNNNGFGRSYNYATPQNLSETPYKVEGIDLTPKEAFDMAVDSSRLERALERRREVSMSILRQEQLRKLLEIDWVVVK